ncbi:acyl-CoA dehydrogenase family protein [Gammaproteobacteria bacterium]|jgi:acyl-CoA dehydrogenase|nr:acyl-CoA dehydrogenase family protein [Gammaproteobacteria bacterium]
MDFEHSKKVTDLVTRLEDFMDKNVYPIEREYEDYFKTTDNLWKSPPLMTELKEKAKQAELWNLFLPESERGAGLTNLEYSPLAEVMGRVTWCSEIFNCTAPDTGNMEVIDRYGSEEQKEQWLEPLLRGEIRSCFSMTEPEVASSDATNIESPIVLDGDEYVINGRKWWSSGAMNEACKIIIFMGKTDPDNPDRHKQQSMILIPMDTPGIKVIRPLSVFNYVDPPFGHAEISFDNVRVPKTNMILGPGRGFEIAQGRLGPGRIHHCMRLIGVAKRALELMCQRAENRIAFGRPLSVQGSVRESIALSASEIEQSRLLTLMAADKMDRYGNKEASDLISMIKVVCPRMACEVIDRAIQIHGAGGLSDDFFLAGAYSYARTLRLADGPDEVHLSSLAKKIIQRNQ